jgi:AcrR family transcriptional regulator
MTQLRADAQRNLGLVLDAAAEVLAERGPDASVDEIARRAGVGHATVFRRFPTKNDLIAAVALARIRALTEVAETALADPDAAAAFEGFMWRAAELHVTSGRLHECFDTCLEQPEHGELERLAAQLVERAQAVGAVRNDVTAVDIGAIFTAVLRSAPADDWRRYVEVVLDGLRPDQTVASARATKRSSGTSSSSPTSRASSRKVSSPARSRGPKR